MNKRIQKQQQHRRLWLIVEIVCVAVFILAIASLIAKLSDSRQRRAEEQASTQAFEAYSETLQAEPTSMPVTQPSAAPDTEPSPDAVPQPAPEALPLLAQNPDFVGMVGFGDMSLYVCQGEDNFYYAAHRFDGTEHPAGMIFMDCRNSLWPLDDNTVLYGHNMRDGSRFGKLGRYTDPEYLQQNGNFRFASLYELHDYVPIAVFRTSVDPESPDYFPFAQIRFSDEAAFDEYIRQVTSRSLYPLPADVSFGDRLLTLATCSEEYDGGRLVIICREA